MTTPDAPQRPLPAVDDLNEFFWTAGRDGTLRFLQCQACSAFVHPPQPACPQCYQADPQPTAVSGIGTVLGWTINHQPWHPAFPPPYAIAVVAIDDDPSVRLTTNIINCDLDAISVGMAVRVVFEQFDDVWLPLFEPVSVSGATA